MTIRDLASNISAGLSLSPSVRTTGTANGTSIDLQGFDSAAVVVAFGAYTDGTHTPSLEHSTNNSTWEAVGAADLMGGFTAVSSSGGANTVQEIGYLGSRRYVRVVMTVATGASGAASAALVIRGHAHRASA
ncbi:MAG: hypothetical protein EBZ69_07205 [Alphaproteobacteria bacterium]|nr:hypothetical protein [Alphaproteobacteria bacterium]NDC56580.1 hypothetical protein [Alphaproteobacteria bacterium]NDG04813.1 hypothetical protein [Alphaproteobacteria bacterium]